LIFADTVLTIIGYHYFDYGDFNPLTIWVFDNLHWTVWILEKTLFVFIIYKYIRILPWPLTALFYIVSIPIMFGAVLYDTDAILHTNLYQPYYMVFDPLLEIPGLDRLSGLLWSIYG